MFGYIHSLESFGTVDGPKIRFIVFFQGCPLRCLYCHNPDSWQYNKGIKIDVDEILQKYDNAKEFLGGITASGGEPLVQIDFLIELFKKAKSKNINTALDTSGILFTTNNIQKFDELIKYTDLVLLDIKHIDDSEHIKLTGQSNKTVLDFAKYLSKNNIPIWIRHVVVPDITLKYEYLEKLGEFLATLKNIKALDVLPYHDMAISKYERLGINYPLKNTKPVDKDEAIKARDIIFNAYKFFHDKI